MYNRTAERETTTPGSRVASTAHAKTGKTPLPYTNVDRWAILGNRGLYFKLRLQSGGGESERGSKESDDTTDYGL